MILNYHFCEFVCSVTYQRTKFQDLLSIQVLGWTIFHLPVNCNSSWSTDVRCTLAFPWEHYISSLWGKNAPKCARVQTAVRLQQCISSNPSVSEEDTGVSWPANMPGTDPAVSRAEMHLPFILKHVLWKVLSRWKSSTLPWRWFVDCQWRNEVV